MAQPEPSLPSGTLVPPLPVRWGRFLFKARDYTAIPLILLALFFATPRPLFCWAGGFILVLLGEVLRFWAAGTIGEKSRTRSFEVFTLVQEGPYSLTRNPLYLGNFLIGGGFFLAATPLWLLLLYLLFFSFQYGFIVRFEEWNLSLHLGEEYEQYRRSVPRWFSLPPPPYRPAPVNLRTALRSERMTLLALVLGILVLFYLRIHPA